MKKLFATIALVSSMGVAYADQPVALTDGQMDNVSAGLYASGAQSGGTAGALLGFSRVSASATTSANWFGTSASAQVTSSAIGFLPYSSAGASSASIRF